MAGKIGQFLSNTVSGVVNAAVGVVGGVLGAVTPAISSVVKDVIPIVKEVTNSSAGTAFGASAATIFGGQPLSAEGITAAMAGKPNGGRADGGVLPAVPTTFFGKLINFYKIDATGTWELSTEGKRKLNWLKIGVTASGVGVVVYGLNKKFRWF